MSHGTHYRWDDIPKEPLRPDLGRKLIATDRMMIAQVFLQKGALVAKHSHENEQLTWIVEGTLRLWLGEDGDEEMFDVAAGEVLHIPPERPAPRRGAREHARRGRLPARRGRTHSS